MSEEKLLYENGYGGFREDGKEYVIRTTEKTTPLPWSHIIANEKFGTLITANGGGYIWQGNSQTNKITSWSNDPIQDLPSERLLLKWREKEVEVLPYHSLEKCTVRYGFGYAVYTREEETICIETLVYVPLYHEKKVYDITITLKEIKEDETNLPKISYTMIPVLGTNREEMKKHLVIEQQGNRVRIQNHYRETEREKDVWIASSGILEAFSKQEAMVQCDFVGQEMQKGKYHLQIEIGCVEEFQAREEFMLQEVSEDLKTIQKFWKKTLERVHVETPVTSMNLMMNGWLIYQTLCCRMWARTSFYQAGGALGFRDQLQDALAMLWVDSEITKQQILLHASHQFEEGDVMHWWHPSTNSGTRTRCSDDLLWLPYVLSHYIFFTGDDSILEEHIPYVKSAPLREDERERYERVIMTEYEDTLYHHAKKAIEKGAQLAENGLPFMQGGDWNDGMNHVQGQSVWLGFFVNTVLENFKKICEKKEDEEAKEKYEKWQARLKEGLLQYGWDGKWFRRAYYTTGEPLGSHQNEEGKIDGISQSWAVMSGIVEEEKCWQAMESFDAYLVDRENMIIKLLTPPFDKTKQDPGYIKNYIPGVRENGGQYTHGAIWSIFANCLLQRGDRAGEYYRLLNPIEHAKTKENAMRYKVEPYVMAADVYASSNMMGRGGWTWYTGSSAWFYLAGLEGILGLQKEGNRLTLNPCLPQDWKECRLTYWYETTCYQINIENSEQKREGIPHVFLDDCFCEKNEIVLVNDHKTHFVEVVL